MKILASILICALCIFLFPLMFYGILYIVAKPQETVITDIAEYENIWDLQGKWVHDESVLFPISVTEEQCLAFNCKNVTDFAGSSWQVLLEIQYDDSSYFSEVERLNNLCVNSPVCGASEYFDKHAYATVWNWGDCFEYAVVDETEKTVCYIYVQHLIKTYLTLDEKYTPKGYGEDLKKSESYSVYEDEKLTAFFVLTSRTPV